METPIQFPCFLKRDEQGNPEYVIIQDTIKKEILTLNVSAMSFEEIGAVMVPTTNIIK